jgi:hypothetical protein
LLHLQCELPAELRPRLTRWWEGFHFPELLSLPGFLSARRGELIGPQGHAPLVTMYGLADPAAADQPRPSSFTLLPAELEGNITFNRRILQRLSELPGDAEPAGTAFLQLLRPASDGDDSRAAAAQIRSWPGVLSTSCWENVANAPHTDRTEVVHLQDSDLIHVELDANDAAALELLARSSRELPRWEASAYRYAPSKTTSPS